MSLLTVSEATFPRLMACMPLDVGASDIINQDAEGVTPATLCEGVQMLVFALKPPPMAGGASNRRAIALVRVPESLAWILVILDLILEQRSLSFLIRHGAVATGDPMGSGFNCSVSAPCA